MTDLDAMTDPNDTAYHEAGHAAIGRVLGYAVHAVSIESDGEGHAGFTHVDVLPKHLEATKDWRLESIGVDDWQTACDDVVITLAGDIAEAKSRREVFEASP